MKEVKLPSGAVLKINPAPFLASKALYQALLREGVHVALKGKSELGDLFKNLLCIGLSSPQVEAALEECLKRCTYNGGNGDLKISEDIFESVSAREDYVVICMEVGKENILPFGKSLYAEFLKLLKIAESDPK